MAKQKNKTVQEKYDDLINIIKKNQNTEAEEAEIINCLLKGDFTKQDDYGTNLLHLAALDKMHGLSLARPLVNIFAINPESKGHNTLSPIELALTSQNQPFLTTCNQIIEENSRNLQISRQKQPYLKPSAPLLPPNLQFSEQKQPHQEPFTIPLPHSGLRYETYTAESPSNKSQTPMQQYQPYEPYEPPSNKPKPRSSLSIIEEKSHNAINAIIKFLDKERDITIVHNESNANGLTSFNCPGWKKEKNEEGNYEYRISLSAAKSVKGKLSGLKKIIAKKTSPKKEQKNLTPAELLEKLLKEKHPEQYQALRKADTSRSR